MSIVSTTVPTPGCVGRPSTIRTQGLQWDVTNWATEFGGQISTSNYVKEDWATVETTKDVLFTIDLDFSSVCDGESN